MSITEKFEQLPKLFKIALLLCFMPTSTLYRMAKYIETQDKTPLFTAIICYAVAPFNLVMVIIDIVCVAKEDNIIVLVKTNSTDEIKESRDAKKLKKRHWTCKYCGENNPLSLLVCRKCGKYHSNNA